MNRKPVTSGPGAQNNPRGIPPEARGGSNERGGQHAAPQNTNTKGNGAQKRQQQKKR